MQTIAEINDEIAQIRGWRKMFGKMDSASQWPHKYYVYRDGRKTTCLPNWTTDIAEAWELASEMPGVHVRHVYDTAYGDKWHCSYQLPEWFAGDTAPIAICRAWLAWNKRNA